jgi:peptidoglycan L-alanyl-D-glutamate endopeptidase CwlK
VSRRADVALLRPDFRAVYVDLIEECARLGIPLQPFETARSPGRQSELYMRGRDPGAGDYGRTVTRAKAYESAHQFGLGADSVFRLANGVWTWDEPEAGMWDTYTRLARARGLETLSFERPHVQIAGFDWRKLPRGPTDEAGWLAWLAAPEQRPAVA